MENVKEVLKLNVEQKGVMVPMGELMVFLDGLITSPEDGPPLTNGNATTASSELSILIRGALHLFFPKLTKKCFIFSLTSKPVLYVSV